MESSSRRRSRRREVLGLTWVFLLLGLALGGWNLPGWAWGEFTRSWPGTEAEVLSSRVRQLRSRRHALGYSPGIVYRYRVKNRNYESDNVMAGDDLMTRPQAVEAARRHPAGARTTAYYWRAYPEFSVLWRGPTPGKGFWVALGLGAAALAAIALLLLRKLWPPPTEEEAFFE